MNTGKTGAGRGRPRMITRERIADAAIAMGLPNVSVVGIAAELGVSPKGIYKHFPGTGEIRQLVAEEIFLRWKLPPVPADGAEGLENYLMAFSASMWELVEKHAGIAPYLLRKDMITPAMMEKMKSHQEDLARAFGLSFAQANRLLFSVAYYCVAVADTVLPFPGETSAENAGHEADGESDAAYEARVRNLYDFGSRALVVGALATLDQEGPAERPG